MLGDTGVFRLGSPGWPTRPPEIGTTGERKKDDRKGGERWDATQHRLKLCEIP